MGRDAEGVFSASQWEPNNGIKGSREFYSAFIRKYRIEPSYHAASAYAAGLLIEEAVRRAGSLDRDKIRNILSIRRERGDGGISFIRKRQRQDTCC